MPDSLSSKTLLVEAAKELVREHGIEKTTVLQITQRAGLNRQTFYKHFSDKYNLVNWACYTEFITVQDEALSKSGWAAVESILSFFEHDRVFFGSGLKDTGQNAFGAYIVEVFSRIIKNFTEEGFQLYGLSEKEINGICHELADDFRTGIVFWLFEEPEKNAREFFDVLNNAARAFSAMICAFNKAAHNTSACEFPFELPMQRIDDEKRSALIDDLHRIER